MKYQPQHDLIDPDYPAPDALPVEQTDDPDAPNDAYVIGERGNTVQAPDGSGKASKDEGPRPWVKPAAAVLAVLFVGLTVWNLSRVMSGPPPPPKPTPFQIKQALYLGVMRVEAYEKVHGVTPETLSDAGLPDGVGYTYMRLDSTHYVLSYSDVGPKLEYSSSDPKDAFFGTPQEMLSMGGQQ